jgi:hypothetical protein
MPPPALPRFFVSKGDPPELLDPLDDGLQPVHALDVFRIGAPHLEPQEWIVALDSAGALRPLPASWRPRLPEVVQGELACHELSGAPGRMLEVCELFFFDVRLAEQAGAVPGLNDPVYLYGTLYGPCRGVPEPDTWRVEGQLTVTRADVLEGLVRGAPLAFRYPGELGRLSCCYHMMLPADREEEIHQGKGIVLAYPLLPPDLALDGAANEALVKQLLFDLLNALKEDLESQALAHPLRGVVLPVPSRAFLEAELKAQGYKVQGDSALPPAGSQAGLRGFLATVFGSFAGRRLTLPPEGTVDDFLALARRALQGLPGWPTERDVALRARIHPLSSGPRPPLQSPPAPRPQPRTPTARAPAPPPQGPPPWVQDFVRSHRPAGSPPPRVTSSYGGSSAPEWMKDFEPRPAAPKPARKPSGPGPARPAWMEDFD